MDYVKFYKLKPGDRIVTPKSLAGIIQHHAVYLGQNYEGQDLIAENVYGKFVALSDSKKFFSEYPQITRIEAFNGLTLNAGLPLRELLSYWVNLIV